MLGDHDLFRKALPYEGSAGVPLIICPPRGSGIAGNQRTDAVADLQDIMPTLLDCAGLPIPEHIDGLSLLPVMRGETPSVRQWLHGEHATLGSSIQWMTDGHEKYIWWSQTGHEQFFDLDADPQELHDLAPGEPSRVAVWRSRLIAELAGREDGHSDGHNMIPGQPVRPILPGVLASFRPSA
jgi:arylsulfatase A-like enzyme